MQFDRKMAILDFLIDVIYESSECLDKLSIRALKERNSFIYNINALVDIIDESENSVTDELLETYHSIKQAPKSQTNDLVYYATRRELIYYAMKAFFAMEARPDMVAKYDSLDLFEWGIQLNCYNSFELRIINRLTKQSGREEFLPNEKIELAKMLTKYLYANKLYLLYEHTVLKSTFSPEECTELLDEIVASIKEPDVNIIHQKLDECLQRHHCAQF